MLLIIIGIVIVWLGFWYVNKVESFWWTTPKYLLNTLKLTLLIALGVVVAIAGVLIPIHGYHEPIIVEEYTLEEIIGDTGIYVIEEENRVPFFSYVANSHESGRSSQYQFSNVEVVVSDKYEKPTLVKYCSKPKKSILTFACVGDNVKYKIYAAEENIKRLN